MNSEIMIIDFIDIFRFPFLQEEMLQNIAYVDLCESLLVLVADCQLTVPVELREGLKKKRVKFFSKHVPLFLGGHPPNCAKFPFFSNLS